MGLDRLSLANATKLFLSNALVYYTVDLATDVHAAGGEVTVENPSPRMDLSLPHVFWKEKSHHANLFRTAPVLAYAKATGSVEITTPLCACGLPMQKYITVLATKRAARVLRPLHGLRCMHKGHEEHAYGLTAKGERAALQSASYPLIFAVVLACAHLGLEAPGIDASGVSPRVVPASVGQLSAPDVKGELTSVKGELTSVDLAFVGQLHTALGAPHRDVDAFSAPAPRGTPLLRSSRTLPMLQASRVRAPNYVEPAGPGWWRGDDSDSDGDLSDAGDDVFTVNACTLGVSSQYRACIKVQPHVDACKASIRTRFSQGPDGTSIRHDIPRGYNEASRHAEAPAIWEAMLREMNAHEDCKTWTLVDAQKCYDEGKEPIDCMWVYDCKVDATTSLFLLWKARLVALGNQQVYLRDYLDTYSGVVRHATFRLFLAICAMFALTVTGADVSTAYLHAPLRDFVVYMKVPRGFPALIGGMPALCRLNMALYGLKQSAREWAVTLIAWLVAYGFVQCTADRYMFRLVTELGVLILLIWVDDIFMGHSNDKLRSLFMGAFADRFRVKDLGPLQQALGASVSQSLSEGWVSFNLTKYISDLARRFDLIENVAWADIPVPVQLAKECSVSKPSDADVLACLEQYAIIVGSIIFIATFARPDVAFAAHFLATFMVRPGPVHLKLARRVLGYLSRTRDLAITYRKGAGDMSVSFSPLDDGAAGPIDATGVPHMMVDTDHGVARSITGWMFMLGSAAVSWAVRGQVHPALSSAESELYGISTCVCDLLTCAQVAEEMGFTFVNITVCTDSRGARLLAMDCAAAARTRHIHRRWYFVRYHIDEEHLNVLLVKGSNNRSNFLTKPVGGKAFALDRAYAMGIGDASVTEVAAAAPSAAEA